MAKPPTPPVTNIVIIDKSGNPRLVPNIGITYTVETLLQTYTCTSNGIKKISLTQRGAVLANDYTFTAGTGYTVYDVTPYDEMITGLIRNGTEYEIEVGNGVPDGGTNGQILGKDPLGPKWQNAPTSGIRNNAIGTTSVLYNEWVGTSAQFSDISNYKNAIYNVIE